MGSPSTCPGNREERPGHTFGFPEFNVSDTTNKRCRKRNQQIQSNSVTRTVASGAKVNNFTLNKGSSTSRQFGCAAPWASYLSHVALSGGPMYLTSGQPKASKQIHVYSATFFLNTLQKSRMCFRCILRFACVFSSRSKYAPILRFFC